MKNKFYVTTPVYYVNDVAHVGHAYTTIAADVMARYHRLLGEDVFSIVGTDEHGAKIAEAAAKVGKEPKVFCDEFSQTFEDLWGKLNISYDHFIRTTDESHERIAKKFLQELYEKEFIYKGTYKGLYCVGCESYKTESDLVEGLCPDHKKVPEELEEENYFFKLSAFNDTLKEKIQSDEILVRPMSRKNEMLGLLEQGLHDIAISRKTVDWGIPLPFDTTQTTYVWIEALMNYVTAHGMFEDEERYQKWWPADIHFVGKDILKFHALIWPAMLLALGQATPKEIFAHGHFIADGQKMSKTLGNVVRPLEVIEKYGVDFLRYYLLAEISFGEDGDVRPSNFPVRYKADLGDGIGNLTSRVLAMSAKLGEWELDYTGDENFKTEVQAFWKKYEEGMKDLKLHEVLATARELIGFCDRYVEEQKPWELGKTDPQKLKQVLTHLLECIRHISLAFTPFMPETTGKIFLALGEDIENENLEELTQWERLKGKKTFSKIEPLFPRIEE